MWRRVIVFIAATILLSAGCASNVANTASTASSSADAPTVPSVAFAGWELEASRPIPAPDLPLEAALPTSDRIGAPRTLTARSGEPLLLAWRNPGPSASLSTRIATSNSFGQSMSFQVRDVLRDAEGNDWIRIRTGEYPNGAEAWVRGTDVRLAPVNQRIVVDISQRRLVRYVDGRVHTRVRIAVGGPNTPTVPGRYFVWARVRYSSPGGAYGKLALGLSGFSEVVRFGPTPGRLAIHGTDDPSDRGQAVSLGCVRVYNGEIDRLWSVPMGTPVQIRP